MLTTNLNARLLTERRKQSSALLCPDAMLNPQLQADFNGQSFGLSEAYKTNVAKSNRRFKFSYRETPKDKITFAAKLIYVGDGVSSKMVDDFCFSSKAGNASSVSDLAF